MKLRNKSKKNNTFISLMKRNKNLSKMTS